MLPTKVTLIEQADGRWTWERMSPSNHLWRNSFATFRLAYEHAQAEHRGARPKFTVSGRAQVCHIWQDERGHHWQFQSDEFPEQNFPTRDAAIFDVQKDPRFGSCSVLNSAPEKRSLSDKKRAPVSPVETVADSATAPLQSDPSAITPVMVGMSVPLDLVPVLIDALNNELEATKDRKVHASVNPSYRSYEQAAIAAAHNNRIAQLETLLAELQP